MLLIYHHNITITPLKKGTNPRLNGIRKDQYSCGPLYSYGSNSVTVKRTKRNSKSARAQRANLPIWLFGICKKIENMFRFLVTRIRPWPLHTNNTKLIFLYKSDGAVTIFDPALFRRPITSQFFQTDDDQWTKRIINDWYIYDDAPKVCFQKI